MLARRRGEDLRRINDAPQRKEAPAWMARRLDGRALGEPCWMVDPGGIEPPSASHRRTVLHA